MTIESIKAAIVKKLQERYPGTPCYGVETLDGYKKPCFFLYLDGSVILSTVNYIQMRCEAEIVRIQPKTNESDAIQFFENTASMFAPQIKVGDQFLSTENLDFSYLGENQDIPQISFEFEYYIKKERETAEIMKQAIIEWRNKKGDYQH